MALLDHFDPEAVTTELAGKVSARTRHVCVLLGAGAARAAGLPDLQGLQVAVVESLEGAHKKLVEKLFETKNLEETLSYLRRLSTILEGEQKVGEFTAGSADALHKEITGAIIPALSQDSAKREPFEHFATWVSGGYYRLPVEVFTINYDLLIETGLESVAVPYFDGFVGHIKARFRSDLVDSIDPGEPNALPASFVRLWKLHGSVNWEEENFGERRRVVRLGSPASSGATAAIYPSDEKYDQSRRVPFLVLMDRFRRALEMPETFTLVSGYAFRDQDLNEIIFDAARAHPRSETAVFCFASVPEQLAEVATVTHNISVFSATEAIIGGRRLPWVREETLLGVWDGTRFILGDFVNLTQFLATKARLSYAGD